MKTLETFFYGGVICGFLYYITYLKAEKGIDVLERMDALKADNPDLFWIYLAGIFVVLSAMLIRMKVLRHR